MATPRSLRHRPTRPRSELADTLVFLLKLAVIVFVFRSFVAAPFSIPSESMLPRLLIGDYLFVAKPAYGYSRWSLPWGMPAVPGHVRWATPARGDVVVFRGPHGDDADIIKRVIGLPGDTVQVRGGQVILNGTPVPKKRVADFVLPLSPNFDASHCLRFQSVEAGKAVCRYPQYEETLPGGRHYDVLDQEDDPAKDDTKLYSVPAGHIFVMGDNRDDSADSRFPAPDDLMPGERQAGMGYVPLDRVEGKAVVGFFSTDGSARWLLPWTWFGAARWRRIGEGF